VRWQIFRRLHINEAGPRYDLSASYYWQNTPEALSGTTSGSDWKGIAAVDHKLQFLRANGFAVIGANYNLDQDHRETMFRAIAQSGIIVVRTCATGLIFW